MDNVSDSSVLLIEPLGAHHDRVAFSCGCEALDHYLKTQASQDAKKHVAAVFILVERHETESPDSLLAASGILQSMVLGFYTLSATSVSLTNFPADIARKIPRYPNVPATLLGRLAATDQRRKEGLGELLLIDALKRSLTQSHEIGSVAVVVEAKTDSACAFYLRYEFIPFLDRPRKLFLPMKTIKKMFS